MNNPQHFKGALMPLPYGSTAKGKIDFWIKQQNPDTKFCFSTIFKSVLNESVTKATVSTHLRDFAANGIIQKNSIKSRDQVWIVLDRAVK